MSDTIKIIIADDHILFIHGLQMLLKEETWIEIVDVAYDGRELLDILQSRSIDIILLDINMPKLNGLESARYIRQLNPSIKIVILSTYNEDHLVEKAKQCGVNGYLLKNSTKDELFQTIKLVMNNQASFPYRVPREANAFDGQDNFLKQFNLTRRETEIIHFLKDELTNQQIANKLFLSIYTVETHRKNIMQKLKLNTPAALMKFILENNI